jgi:hypothetical protein
MLSADTASSSEPFVQEPDTAGWESYHAHEPGRCRQTRPVKGYSLSLAPSYTALQRHLHEPS